MSEVAPEATPTQRAEWADEALRRGEIPFSEIVSDAQRLVAGEEAPAEESSPEEAAAEAPEGAQPEAEFQIPDLDVDVPEDYREISEMPDFDAEAEAELQSEENIQQEDGEYEYEDDQSAALRKRALAAEKRAKWLEQKHVEQNIGKWKSEATKYYPLAQPFIDAGLIKADSRRAFAREAKRVHEVMKPYVAERFLKPLEEALKGREATDKEKSAQEQAEQWGPARTGPNQVPAQATRAAQEYEGRQRARTLVDEMKDVLGFTGR